MKVKRNTLLLIAGLVWSAAGGNILRIGIISYPNYLTAVNYLLSVLVFALFYGFIFRNLVKKHTARITAYPDCRHFALKFFDKKSFVMMAGMMTFGILLRSSTLAPQRFIAVFYTGLGAALFMAGLLFARNYVQAQAFKCMPHKDITNKEDRNMKRYINAALIYAILAMADGVFYREFTKFNGFTAKTTLAVGHTHYFMLGMAFFLLLLLLERSFAFTNAKTGKTLLVYHIGLNLTSVMLLIRGVTQVLGTTLSTGMSAAISGIAGIGHILLGISMVLLLLQVKRSVTAAPAR